jgi:hypothetical protein
MIDESMVILNIQAVINAKISNQWYIHTLSHSNYLPNI